jgi:hypothetical protein
MVDVAHHEGEGDEEGPDEEEPVPHDEERQGASGADKGWFW